MDYYTVITFIVVISMGIVQICLKRSNTLSNAQKKTFKMFFNVIAISAFCEWFAIYLEQYPKLIIPHIIVKIIELSLAPSIAFIFSLVISRKHIKGITLFLGLHAFLEWLSGVFGFIFYVDSNNIYHHGSLYGIYMFVYIVSFIYCTYIVYKSIHRFQYSGMLFYSALLAFLLFGIFLQIFVPSLKVTYLIITVVSIMTYVFTLEMVQQTDELTELLNRRGYENYINHLEEKCAVIFFDINKFKLANDNLGHQFGDYVLKNIGVMIKDVYAKYGKCFRYGGDEFCVILNKNIDNVENLNHDFFLAIAKKREDDPNMCSVSIGYAYYDPDNQNIEDAIKEADDMMYRYKKSRNEAKGL